MLKPLKAFFFSLVIGGFLLGFRIFTLKIKLFNKKFLYLCANIGGRKKAIIGDKTKQENKLVEQ